jgi:hypothetical protein
MSGFWLNMAAILGNNSRGYSASVDGASEEVEGLMSMGLRWLRFRLGELGVEVRLEASTRQACSLAKVR